ncbi:MAG: polyprenyl synthetase family protein [Clostridiaceae bacterium]
MNSFFESSILKVEKRLDEISSGFTCESELKDSMRYSLLANGKRLRPLMVLISAELSGMDSSSVLDMACAMEMIHTYSLIHDDLPAMDDDDLRRGKPTNHVVFGEAMAILAGDALLNEAHRLLIDKYSGTINGRNAVLDISEAAGKDGMINGQVLDILSEGKNIDMEVLKKIHKNKTGALIRASLTSPFYLAGKSGEEIKPMKNIGENMGLLFQIQDDILDATSDAKTLGKTPGKDERDNKVTYVSLIGLTRSKDLVESIYDDIVSTINNHFGEGSLLMDLLDMIMSRNR